MIVHITVVDANEIFMSQQRHSTIRYSIDSVVPRLRKNGWNPRESLLLFPKAGGGTPRLDGYLGSVLLCTYVVVKRYNLQGSGCF